jgi:CCR4-NOT transcription complex subunit 7/8
MSLDNQLNITKTDNYYHNIKCNVDNLKIIQIGITLANAQGEFPDDISSWQFNFKFDTR